MVPTKPNAKTSLLELERLDSEVNAVFDISHYFPFAQRLNSAAVHFAVRWNDLLGRNVILFAKNTTTFFAWPLDLPPLNGRQ